MAGRFAVVALKGPDIERFVTRPDPARPVVLIFGPDAGLVRERAEALVAIAHPDHRADLRAQVAGRRLFV